MKFKKVMSASLSVAMAFAMLSGGTPIVNAEAKEKSYRIEESTQTVTVKFIDGNKEVGTASINVATEETKINTDLIKDLVPEGYEIQISSDLLIENGTVTVEVKEKGQPIAEKTVTIYFIDEKDNTPLTEWTTVKVAEDEVHVNTNDLTAPKGYEFAITGDYFIEEKDSQYMVNVVVRKLEETNVPSDKEDENTPRTPENAEKDQQNEGMATGDATNVTPTIATLSFSIIVLTALTFLKKKIQFIK